MYISEDGNRAYFGTNIPVTRTSSHNDTSTKREKTYHSICKYRYDSKSFICCGRWKCSNTVGTGERVSGFYFNETNPIKCGGMHIDNGIYDIDSLTDPQGNAFSYIVTGDTNNEFKIIRGGPGGGDEETGNGYVPSGNYLSIISDSKSTNSTYYTLYLLTQVPEGTTMEVQYRISDSPTMVGAQWRGPDGTPNTFYSTTGTYSLPQGTKYFNTGLIYRRYKHTFT